MKREFLRGVNLGGWLVLERWMTPSLFAGTDAVDEYTFMQTKGAAAKLKSHRDTFITDRDFKWLQDNNLNAIRLPVGYWILEADQPYKTGIHHVDWAFEMAEKYHLKVLLDLHGAPCSQNGNNHSGRVGDSGWFDSKQARQRTTVILQSLHERYKNSPSYWGIELLNEPKSTWLNTTLRQFYRDTSRTIDGSRAIIFHDAYRPRFMNGALQGDNRAILDVHLYHMASWLAPYISAKQFVNLTQWWWGRLLRRLIKRQPVIIGEWSIVLKDKKIASMKEAEAIALMHRFGHEQLAVYEQYAAGWFYWNYKSEEQGLWNFRWLLESDTLELPPKY